MKNIFRIVNIGEAQVIQKSDGTELVKQQLVLREQGGQYEDAYLVTWLGQEALKLTQGMCIAASVRMRVSEGTYSAGGDKPLETRYYQDAILQEYACLMLGNVKC